MQFNNRNERKKFILALLNNMNTPYTAKEIHDLCSNVSLSSICASLKNYYTQGLLERKKENGIFVYQITKKGIKRLEYLENNINTIEQVRSVKEEVQLLVREPIRKLSLLRE